MKILLLNPNIDAGHQIAQALRKDKMDILLPENVKEAWQLLHFHGNNLDLLIINREGPKETESEVGLKLVEKIKGDPQFSNIPLILTTSQWTEKECADHQNSSFGANAYLCGMIHEAQLRNLIQAVMETQEDSNLAQSPELELSPVEESVKKLAPEASENQPPLTSEGPLLEDVGQIFKSNPINQDALSIKLDLFEPSSQANSGIEAGSSEEGSSDSLLSIPSPLPSSQRVESPVASEQQSVDSDEVLISSTDSAPSAIELMSPLEMQALPEGSESVLAPTPTPPLSSDSEELSESAIEISPAPELQLENSENLASSESLPEVSPDSSFQSQGQSSHPLPPLDSDQTTSPSLEISLPSQNSPEGPSEISLPPMSAAPDEKLSGSPSAQSFAEVDLPELPSELPQDPIDPSSSDQPEVSDLPPPLLPSDDSLPAQSEAEGQALDAEVEQELPYLFNSPPTQSSDHLSSDGEIGKMVFSQPIGDAIVPGGVAHSPDLETLKKYLLLREQDVSILSNQLQSAKDQNLATEQLLREEKAKNSEMNHVIQELKQKIEDFEKTKASEMEILQSEMSELRFQVKAKADKARKLESQTKELSDEMDRVKERVRIDIRKIRVREKELENRLELARKDSEALLSARENKIIELKRKLDLLEFNMDLLQDQYNREKENTVILKDRLAKAAQVVRVMGGLLDSNKKLDTNDS